MLSTKNPETRKLRDLAYFKLEDSLGRFIRTVEKTITEITSLNSEETNKLSDSLIMVHTICRHRYSELGNTISNFKVESSRYRDTKEEDMPMLRISSRRREDARVLSTEEASMFTSKTIERLNALCDKEIKLQMDEVEELVKGKPKRTFKLLLNDLIEHKIMYYKTKAYLEKDNEKHELYLKLSKAEEENLVDEDSEGDEEERAERKKKKMTRACTRCGKLLLL